MNNTTLKKKLMEIAKDESEDSFLRAEVIEDLDAFPDEDVLVTLISIAQKKGEIIDIYDSIALTITTIIEELGESQLTKISFLPPYIKNKVVKFLCFSKPEWFPDEVVNEVKSREELRKKPPNKVSELQNNISIVTNRNIDEVIRHDVIGKLGLFRKKMALSTLVELALKNGEEKYMYEKMGESIGKIIVKLGKEHMSVLPQLRDSVKNKALTVIKKEKPDWIS